MKNKPAAKIKTRGRGRPALNPDGRSTMPLSVRLAQPEYAELMRLITAGYARLISEAVRAAIQRSAAQPVVRPPEKAKP